MNNIHLGDLEENLGDEAGNYILGKFNVKILEEYKKGILYQLEQNKRDIEDLNGGSYEYPILREETREMLIGEKKRLEKILFGIK